MTDDEIAALAAGTVDALKARLPDMSLDELNRLRTAETAGDVGASRSTALDAIDRAIGQRTADTSDDANALNRATDEAGLQARAAAPSTAATSDAELQARASSASADALATGGTSPDPVAESLVAGAVPAQPDPAPAQATLPVWETAGKPLAALMEMRRLEVNGASRAAELDKLDRAIADLRKAGADAPAVEGGTTASRIVDTPAARDAATGGPSALCFADGQSRLDTIPAIPTDPSMFHIDAGRVIFDRRITLPAGLAPSRVTHVWLLGDAEEVAGLCEVPGGVVAGGGREVELPAGSLAF